MIDFMESLENMAEGNLYEMTKNLPPGKFRCSCGKIADLNRAMPATPNPYSMPICENCYL